MKKENCAKMVIFIASLLLFAVTGVRGETSDTYLDRIEKEYANVKSITAKCTQNFYNKTMDKNFTFNGTMYIRRPDKFRWEITDPDEQLIVIDGNNLWIYTKENNQVIKENSGKKGRAKLALLLLADISELKKNFKIIVDKDEGKSIELALTPNETLSDVKSAKLIVEKSRYRITDIEIIDAYDNRSVYSFRDTVFNGAIPDSKFKYIPPEGVEVIDSSSI